MDASPNRMRRPRRAALFAVLVIAPLTLLTACGGTSHPNRPSAAPSPTSASPSETTSLGDRPPPGFVPATASFPAPQIGYAWGIAPCVRDRSLFCPGIAATTDGGKSWHSLTAPTGLPTDPYHRAILRFSDSSDGWAILNGIQVTHDGSVSWQSVSLPGVRIPRVAAFETGVATAYVVASDAAVANSPLRLYVTNATSNSFRLVPGVALDAAGADVSISLGLDGSGYLAGNAVGGPPVFYALANDGRWLPRQAPCGAGTTATVAAGLDQQVTVVCDGLSSSSGAPKTAWQSADGGESFEQRASPPAAGFTEAAAYVPDPPLPASSYFPSTSSSASSGDQPNGTASTPAAPNVSGQALVVVASARSDHIYLTENHARSWTVAFASGGDASHEGLGVADLAFSDSTHGVVILGDAGLYVRDRAAGRHLVPGPRLLTTQDGGRHWAQTVISEE